MGKRRGVRLPGVRVWRLSHRYQPGVAERHSNVGNFFPRCGSTLLRITRSRVFADEVAHLPVGIGHFERRLALGTKPHTV